MTLKMSTSTFRTSTSSSRFARLMARPLATRFCVALLVAASMSAATVVHAQTVIGTVVNAFNCDRFNRCRQVNGEYHRSAPTHCKLAWGLVNNPNRSISLCNKWVASF